MPVSEETKDFLDQVKKGKSRKFVMIVKGATILNLVLYKKGVATKYIKEAKDAIDGPPGIPYFGVVTGKGVDINFQMSVADGFKASPVKTPVLKKYLEEEADFKCMPLVEIVEHTPLVIDPDDELHARFLGLQTKVTTLCDALPHEAGPLTATVRDIGKTLDLEQRDDAKIRIDLFEEQLDKLEQQVNYQTQRQKIEPLLRMTQRVAPDKATALENIWVYSETQAEAGNYKKAVDGLVGLVGALKKIDVQKESEKTTAEKLGIGAGVVGDAKAKLTFDKDYGALKDRLAEATKLQTAAVSQTVKDKATTLVEADKQVSDKAGEEKYAEASGLMTSLNLIELLVAVETAKKEFDEAKSVFETTGYGASRSDVDKVLNTWGTDISAELKSKRTALDNAAKQVVAEEKKLDYAAANRLFTDLKVAELLTAADEAKKTFDKAKVDFDNDYGALLPRVLEVMQGWGSEISTELKGHETTISKVVESITNYSDAFDFVKAHALIASEDLEGKLALAEAAKNTFDQAKIRVEDYFNNSYGSADEVFNWPDTVTNDMRNLRDVARAAYDLVGDEARKFEYVEADRLLVAEDVSNKVLTALNRGRIDCDALDAECNLYWNTNFIAHPQWAAIESIALATGNLHSEAQVDNGNMDYGIALEKFRQVKREYAEHKVKADKYGEFVEARKLPQKYIEQLKGHTWKVYVKAAEFCELKMTGAKLKADAFDFVEANKLLTQITERYKKTYTDELKEDLQNDAVDAIDRLDKHARKSVVASEIADLRKQATAAEISYKNGIFKAAAEIIDEIKSECRRCTRIADACVAYEKAVTAAKLKLQDLTTRVQPAVADDVAALEELLKEAEKLALPAERRYAEAGNLLNEIETAYPSLKKVLDDYDRTAKQKTDTLNQEPGEVIKELRRQIAAFASKPDEVQAVVKASLDTAEEKLKEADLQLVNN